MYKYHTDNPIISLSWGDACVFVFFFVEEKCAQPKCAFQEKQRERVSMLEVCIVQQGTVSWLV